MSLPISIPKSPEQLPLAGLLTLTRTAFGLGVGMLVADKIKRPADRRQRSRWSQSAPWRQFRSWSGSPLRESIGRNRSAAAAIGFARSEGIPVIVPRRISTNHVACHTPIVGSARA